MKRRQSISRIVMALFFIVAGMNHFRSPAIYLSMMPPWLPWPDILNLVSGVAEIAGGAGILHPRTRCLAGWWLIALLAAVFPANLHVALNGWPEVNLARWVLWARLPLQLVLMLWVYQSCLRGRGSRGCSGL